MSTRYRFQTLDVDDLRSPTLDEENQYSYRAARTDERDYGVRGSETYDKVDGDESSGRDEALLAENRRLTKENSALRQCLYLTKQHSDLKTANYVTSVLSWCDNNLKKYTLDMWLTQNRRSERTDSSRPQSAFKPVSVNTNSKSSKTKSSPTKRLFAEDWLKEHPLPASKSRPLSTASSKPSTGGRSKSSPPRPSSQPPWHKTLRDYDTTRTKPASRPRSATQNTTQYKSNAPFYPAGATYRKPVGVKQSRLPIPVRKVNWTRPNIEQPSSLEYSSSTRGRKLSPERTPIFAEYSSARSRSPSPSGRASPSPIVMRSPSPSGRRTPSPIVRRSPSPIGRRTPSPIVRQSPSPSGRRTPSPIVRRSPSPIVWRSPSPSGIRTLSPSVLRSPSPSGRRTPSPPGRRTPSPSERRTPSPSGRRTPLSTSQRGRFGPTEEPVVRSPIDFDTPLSRSVKYSRNAMSAFSPRKSNLSPPRPSSAMDSRMSPVQARRARQNVFPPRVSRQAGSPPRPNSARQRSLSPTRTFSASQDRSSHLRAVTPPSIRSASPWSIVSGSFSPMETRSRSTSPTSRPLPKSPLESSGRRIQSVPRTLKKDPLIKPQNTFLPEFKRGGSAFESKTRTPTEDERARNTSEYLTSEGYGSRSSNTGPSSNTRDYGPSTNIDDYAPSRYTKDYEPPSNTRNYELSSNIDDYVPSRDAKDYEPPSKARDYGPASNIDDYEPSRYTKDYEPPSNTRDYVPSRDAKDYEPPSKTRDYGPSSSIDDYEPSGYTKDYEPPSNTRDYGPSSSNRYYEVIGQPVARSTPVSTYQHLPTVSKGTTARQYEPAAGRYEPTGSATVRYEPPGTPTGRYEPPGTATRRYEPSGSATRKYAPPSSLAGRYEPNAEDSLAELLGISGHGASEKARGVVFRAVDTLTGYRPNLTQEIKRNLSRAKHNKRIIGEIAFQLDRRILEYVFSVNRKKKKNARYYGYSLTNILQMIYKEAAKEGFHNSKTELKLRTRLENILRKLSPFGYILDIHSEKSQDMVNKYGLLNGPPDQNTVEGFGLNDPAVLRVILSQIIRDENDLYDMLIMLDCLCYLSYEDGQPIFMW